MTNSKKQICENLKFESLQTIDKKEFKLRETGHQVHAKIINHQSNKLAYFRPDKEFRTIEACDFFLANCLNNYCWLIELKGSNLNKAINQISQTIKQMENLLNIAEFITAIVVVTKVSFPRYKNTPKYLSLRKELDKHCSANNQIKVICNTAHIIIS